MSKSDAFETDILGLIYNATAIPNIADNAATSPLTELFVALHTADPGERRARRTLARSPIPAMPASASRGMALDGQ